MINFVYFDLGGVVMSDLTTNGGWEKMKKDMGVPLKRDQEFEKFFDEYEAEVSVGQDVETLVPLMKNKFGMKFPSGYTLLADMVSRFEKNESIWPVLEFVQKHCRIGLLTNMYPGMLTAIKNKGILPNITWDVTIDSTAVKVAKPDPKIFQMAEEKSGAIHEEILFVDNSQGNIDAAKNFGWQTFFYDSTHPEASSRQLSVYLTDQLGSLKDHAGN